MKAVAAVLSKRSQKGADQTLHLLLCNPQLLLLGLFPFSLPDSSFARFDVFGYLGVNPWTQVGLACCEPTPFIVGCKVHCKPCPAYIWIHCTVALDSLVWCGNIQTDSWTEDLLDKLGFGNLATSPTWLVLGLFLSEMNPWPWLVGGARPVVSRAPQCLLWLFPIWLHRLLSASIRRLLLLFSHFLSHLFISHTHKQRRSEQTKWNEWRTALAASTAVPQ